MATISIGYAADGTPQTYTTLAAAQAVAVKYDNVQIYFKNATKSNRWYEAGVQVLAEEAVVQEVLLVSHYS